MKTIEVNLGVGMNMLFPETVKIVIDDTFQKRYESYLEFGPPRSGWGKWSGVLAIVKSLFGKPGDHVGVIRRNFSS